MASQWFSDDYKYQVFLLWYNKGRPSAQNTWNLIPGSWGENKPTVATINGWIHSDKFKEQADALDVAISDEIESRMILEKVEMLSRHADLGLEMQDMAITFIRNKKDELTSNAAVRLLIEGIRIERESRGIPQALEKMIDKSDQELLEEVSKLIGGSEVEILND